MHNRGYAPTTKPEIAPLYQHLQSSSINVAGLQLVAGRCRPLPRDHHGEPLLSSSPGRCHAPRPAAAIDRMLCRLRSYSLIWKERREEADVDWGQGQR